jgi:hypothetical protein
MLGAVALSTTSFVAYAEDDVAPALDRARRMEVAESILRQREEASGRPFDARHRATMRADLAARPTEELVALESGAVIPNAFGDPAADLVYTPVTPCRVFDTRFAVAGILAANTQRNFLVAGAVGFANQGGNAAGCAIPFGPATSVVINFAAVNPAGAGNLRAWAVANPQPAAPTAAVMNYSPTLAALANGIAVPICNTAGGACASDLRLQADVSAVHIVGDVVGYFARPVNVVNTLESETAIGALDIDLSPEVCVTTDITPTRNQTAIVLGTAALQATAALSYQLRLVVSSDAGTTWTTFTGNNGRGSAGVAAEWAVAAKFGSHNLAAGTQYRFALEILRAAGTGDATAGRCDTFVQLFPR